MHKVCNAFEIETYSISTSNHHPYPGFINDLKKILTVLEEQKVFYPLGNRNHSNFKFKNGWLQHLSQDKLIDMIKKNVSYNSFSVCA